MGASKTSTESHELDFKRERDRNARVNKTGLDTSKIKKTNRLIRSCMSCKKRKVKCNFDIPCDRCIARNQAHLCSREPVIFDGMIVSNEDEMELKFQQENEVLKKKIKELQDTIMKMKNPIESTKNLSPEGDLQNEARKPPVSISNNKLTKLKLDSQVISDKRLKYARTKSNLVNPERWEIYASTVCMLKTALTNGMVLETLNSETCEVDYNTEEWLILKDKQFADYGAEDTKSQTWQYELTRLVELDRSTCEKLVMNGMKYFDLVPIKDKSTFMKEFHEYWDDDSISPKHIDEKYSKNPKSHLFLGMMYGLMCLGVYHCSEESEKELPFTEDDWDTYPKALFAASLESLFRSRFMTHPYFESIPVIALHRLISGVLGGNFLSNNLTSVALFVAHRLGVTDSSDNEKVTNMWYLLAYDWYNDHERYSLSELNTFPQLKQISIWTHATSPKINWRYFYLNIYLHVSILKKKYYHSAAENTLENLSMADIELRYLQLESFQQLESFSSDSDKSISLESFKFIEFQCKSLLLYESLEVNTKLAQFMSYEEWSKRCYQTCYNNAMEITETFTSAEIPQHFKFYPAICAHVIFAAVFLIVNCLLDSKHFRQHESLKTLVKKCVTIFESKKSLVRCAARGTYVLEKLLSLLNFRTRKRKEKHISLSKKKEIEAAEDSAKVTTDFQCQAVTSNPPVILESNTAPIFVNNKNVSDSEGDSSDSYSDYSSDSDDNLYYLTMIRQKAKINNNITANIGANIDLRTPVALDEQLSQFRPAEEQNANFGTPQGTVDVNFNNVLSPVRQTNTTEPRLHHTIMDILEDFGWTNFMSSMDNLESTEDPLGEGPLNYIVHK